LYESHGTYNELCGQNASFLILQQLALLLTAELQAINFTFTANRKPLKTQQTKVNKQLTPHYILSRLANILGTTEI